MEHTTYNMTFALVAFAEGLEVYVAHPEDDDVRMWSEDEIEDCEGHLFVIKWRGRTMTRKVSILWGEDLLEDGDVAETYCFATESELKAFMQAVHVMDGYFGCPYQIVEEGYIHRDEDC